MQGAWVRSLVRELDPTCCNEDPNKLIKKKKKRCQGPVLQGAGAVVVQKCVRVCVCEHLCLYVRQPYEYQSALMSSSWSVCHILDSDLWVRKKN